MTVVGAAFTTSAAARAAERELIELLAIEPGCINRAPLGAVGRRSEGRSIVAARISRQSVAEATRILVRHGGEIVTTVSALPGAEIAAGVEAKATTRH